MLDALKVLFILTGASTYLVTKYVKVGLETKNDTIIGNPLASMSPELKHYWETSLAKNGNNNGISNGLKFGKQAYNERKKTISGKSRDIINDTKNVNSVSVNNNLNDDIIETNTTKSEAIMKSILEEAEAEDEVIEYIKPTYVIKLVEEDNKLMPKLLLQVAANSKSINEKNKIIYFLDELNGESDFMNKFSVNSTTGELFILSALDRDLPYGRPEWEMTILAKYDTSDSAFGFADVIIHLTDINDNKPIFEKNVYVMNISENHSLIENQIIKLSAIDLDDSDTENGKIYYSILPVSNVFTIDSQTGIISYFNCCIDRETEPQYTFEVFATDGGGLSSSATLIINIIDMNDTPPRFIKNNWTTEVSFDHSLDEPILQLRVEDKDLLENNYFYCQLLNGQLSDEFLLMTNLDGSCSLFMTKLLSNIIINNNNSLIRNLTVCVSDNGPNPIIYSDSSHSDCASVTVTLLESNSNETYLRRHFDVNPCLTIICINGGTCLNVAQNNFGFQCQCLNGFSGLFCDITDSNNSSNETVIIKLGNPAVIAILICLINALILLLIIVIYTQTRSQIRPKTFIKSKSKESVDNSNQSKLSITGETLENPQPIVEEDNEDQRLENVEYRLNQFTSMTPDVVVTIHQTPPSIVRFNNCSVNINSDLCSICSSVHTDSNVCCYNNCCPNAYSLNYTRINDSLVKQQTTSITTLTRNLSNPQLQGKMTTV